MPLSQFATFEYEQVQPLIWRRDLVPTLTVLADIVPGTLPETAVTALSPSVETLTKTLPESYSIVVGGTVEESKKSQASVIAVVPMMLIDHMRHMGLAPDTMVLIGTGLYLAIRFEVGHLLRNYTVHRGMFHSLPAAAISEKSLGGRSNEMSASPRSSNARRFPADGTSRTMTRLSFGSGPDFHSSNRT